MDKQQVLIEMQLKDCSTQLSKGSRSSRLLPAKDVIIDLTENWEWHNCIITRIVLTKAAQVDKIVAIPAFIQEFMKGRLHNV